MAKRKNFNEFACTEKGQRFTTAWLKKKSPLVYLYGHSGAGKTYAFGTLLDHAIEDADKPWHPYAPVHYIDGDMGHETIGERAENEELCTLVNYDGRYDGMLLWFFRKLAEAEQAECGAILIEGASALFSSMLAPAVMNLAEADGADLWGAHKEPSARISTFWEAIRRLKVNRNHDGIGVPIFVSLNTRELGEQGSKYVVPDFSPNVTDKCMRTADAFLELRRDSVTKMICKPSGPSKFRKLRREAVADQVQRAENLTLPGLLTLWAFTAALDTRKLSNTLAALLPSIDEVPEIPEIPETPAPDTAGAQ